MEKITELEGKIEETEKKIEVEAKPSDKKEKKDKNKKDKSKSSKSKKGKGAKEKQIKLPDELTEDELNSINTLFVPRAGALKSTKKYLLHQILLFFNR